MKTENQSNFARGDKWLYFLFHNLLSVWIFYSLVTIYSIAPYYYLFNIITPNFLQNLGLVFVFSLVSAIFSRVLTFIFLKRVFFKYIIKRSKVRRWDDLNQGINKMDGTWILAMLFSSLAFMIGATFLLDAMLFSTSENNLFTLMISYLIIKIVTIIIVRKKM